MKVNLRNIMVNVQNLIIAVKIVATSLSTSPNGCKSLQLGPLTLDGL